jgi:hypothetical protein
LLCCYDWIVVIIKVEIDWKLFGALRPAALAAAALATAA